MPQTGGDGEDAGNADRTFATKASVQKRTGPAAEDHAAEVGRAVDEALDPDISNAKIKFVSAEGTVRKAKIWTSQTTYTCEPFTAD